MIKNPVNLFKNPVNPVRFCLLFVTILFSGGLFAQDETSPTHLLADLTEVRTKDLADLGGLYFRLGDEEKSSLVIEELRRRDPTKAKIVEASLKKWDERRPVNHEAADAYGMLEAQDPQKAILYLENLQTGKYGNERFPHWIVLAEAYDAAANKEKALAILHTQLQSEYSPQFEREAAVVLLAKWEMPETESVTSTPSGQSRNPGIDVPPSEKPESRATVPPGSSPLEHSFRVPTGFCLYGIKPVCDWSGLGLVGDYQNHPDGDLHGIHADFSQFVTHSIEVGLRARSLSIQLGRGSDIVASDAEVFAAESFLRWHGQFGYAEILGGSGSHDEGTGGFAMGRVRQGFDDWGGRLAAMVNSPLEDSLQMMALDATQDAIRLDFETGHEKLDFSFRGEVREVELKGQEIGSGYSLSWELSRLIWENELANARTKLSYVGTYSNFDGENIPLALQPAMGINPTANLQGNAFFLKNIHQQGLTVSYLRECGSCLQFGGCAGILADFDDEDIEHFVTGGTYWLPKDNVRIGLEAGCFSDGSVYTQDDGPHTRVQSVFRRQF